MSVNKELNCICAHCTKSFYRSPSKLRNSKSGLQFCSRVCKDTAQRIGGIKDIMPPHYGTGKIRYDYRIKALSFKEEKCERCSWSQYPDVLIVHHKDRDRKNSSLENLEILCPLCHDIEHYLKRDGRFSKWSE